MAIVAGFGAEAVGQRGASQGPFLAGVTVKARNWPVTAGNPHLSSLASLPASASFLSSWQSQIASLASGTSADVDSGVGSEASSESANLIAETLAGELPAPSSTSAKSCPVGMEMANNLAGGTSTSGTVPGQTTTPRPTPALRMSIVHAHPVAVSRTMKIWQIAGPSSSTIANKQIDHQRTTHKSLYSSASFSTGLPSTDSAPSGMPAVTIQVPAAINLRESPSSTSSGADRTESSLAGKAGTETGYLSNSTVASTAASPITRNAATLEADDSVDAKSLGLHLFDDPAAVPEGSTEIQTAAEGPPLIADKTPNQVPSLRGNGRNTSTENADPLSHGPAVVVSGARGNQRFEDAPGQSAPAMVSGYGFADSTVPVSANGDAGSNAWKATSVVQTQSAQMQHQVPNEPVNPPENLATSSSSEDTAGESTQVGARLLAATLPKMSSPGTVAISRAPEHAALRSTRAAASIELNEHLPRPFQTANGAIVTDASGLVGDPEAMRGTTDASPGNASLSPASTTASSANEAFAALDADMNSSIPSWIHAGARRAEAGYQDPALGWIGVRAEVNGGGVHATLLPSSSEAAQVLGGHMAGLDAYLAAEHAPVRSLTLTTPGGREPGLASGQDLSQGMNQGSGQSDHSEPKPSTLVPMAAIATSVSRVTPVQSGRLEHTAEIPRRGGTHISVVA
jgi:hypothetical protein